MTILTRLLARIGEDKALSIAHDIDEITAALGDILPPLCDDERTPS